MTSSPHTGVKARAQRYLDAQPKDDGRTFHADHPEVIIAELIAEGSTLERELEEARASNEQWQEIANENGLYGDNVKEKLDEALADRDLWLREYNNARKDRHSLFTASQAEVERLREALGHHERLLLINSVRNAAKAEAPLWLEAADHAAESVRAQVEERKP